MSVLGILLLLIVAAIVGAIGQLIAGYSLGGCLVSAAVGLVGALIGVWLADLLNLPEIFAITIDGQTFPLVWAILGSVLFVAVIGFLSRGRRRAI